MRPPVERLEDGSYKVNGVVVFSCGCGGVGAKANQVLVGAGVDPKSVTIVTTSSNLNSKEFIKQSGLAEAEPSLRRNKHAVLYNSNTHKFINILNSKRDKNILSNIYRVVNGS